MKVLQFTKRELEAQIARDTAQAEQAKLFAMLRHGEIVSGGYKLHKKQQGREPTPEEKAQGFVIGYRECTDEEMLEDRIETMRRHIHWYGQFSEAVANLMLAKKVGEDLYEVEFEEFDL